MRSNNKKTLESIKNETIIPIGFYEHNKSHSIFCRIKEHPNHIYIIPGKRNDFSRFSEYKELVVFKSGFLDETIKPGNIDKIISSKVNNKKVITFNYKKGKESYLYWAISKKENEWIVQGGISKIKEIGGAVSDHKHGKNYFIYYGESSLRTVFSPDFIKWKKSKDAILKSRPGFFDKGDLKFISSKITAKGILVFYDASTKDNEKLKIQVGVAMFSLSDPHKLIWRADEPIFEDQIAYEQDFECKGMLYTDSELAIYWYSKNTGILMTSLSVPFSSNLTKEKIKILSRHKENPIVSPKAVGSKDWMSEGTFNPTAVNIDGDIHILFRAIGSDGISRVGYALSKDGLNIDYVHSDPVFSLKRSHFGAKLGEHKYSGYMYPSGGSWGGCEDPRMVNIDDKIYITFNAFDNWNNIRVGMTSISKDDFLNKKWKSWKLPKLITPPGSRHKNWVLFPEKINGKFAVLHNLHNIKKPNSVLVDYFDSLKSLEKGEADFESPDPQKLPNKKISWHIRMRGVGPAPLKTEDGWLVFYHATDAAEPNKYKVGVMLLDLKDPTKIIARSSYPILCPDMWYENDWKIGIVYTCGAVIKDDNIFIYYGGGDKHVCVATVPFKKFMDDLKGEVDRPIVISKVIFS
ncbi:MAG: hypothetical protein WC933_03330 [Candidatus Paceibacterota bacterium]|jgi:predicted GH43/DUF377 family glycosyl hydrolase